MNLMRINNKKASFEAIFYERIFLCFQNIKEYTVI